MILEGIFLKRLLFILEYEVSEVYCISLKDFKLL